MTVGYARFFVCEKCGKRIELAWGMSYLYGWGNTELLERIDSGKYGRKAKEVLESHQEALCHLEDHPFICRCGHIEACKSLVMMSNDLSKPEVYYSSEHMCPVCNKRMRPLKESDEIRCPGCGGEMEEDLKSMIMMD